MKWIFNYIRRKICSHQFEFSEQEIYFIQNKFSGIKVLALCKKCGDNQFYIKGNEQDESSKEF